MNAKEELLDVLNRIKTIIKCANIDDKLLKVNHSKEEFKSFMDSLNFKYDAGYGGQELYGTVWLNDGTWLERGEYDGSEWWDHHKLPQIPEKLK